MNNYLATPHKPTSFLITCRIFTIYTNQRTTSLIVFALTVDIHVVLSKH